MEKKQLVNIFLQKCGELRQHYIVNFEVYFQWLRRAKREKHKHKFMYTFQIWSWH